MFSRQSLRITLSCRNLSHHNLVWTGPIREYLKKFFFFFLYLFRALLNVLIVAKNFFLLWRYTPLTCKMSLDIILIVHLPKLGSPIALTFWIDFPTSWFHFVHALLNPLRNQFTSFFGTDVTSERHLCVNCEHDLSIGLDVSNLNWCDHCEEVNIRKFEKIEIIKEEQGINDLKKNIQCI